MFTFDDSNSEGGRIFRLLVQAAGEETTTATSTLFLDGVPLYSFMITHTEGRGHTIVTSFVPEDETRTVEAIREEGSERLLVNGREETSPGKPRLALGV